MLWPHFFIISPLIVACRHGSYTFAHSRIDLLWRTKWPIRPYLERDLDRTRDITTLGCLFHLHELRFEFFRIILFITTQACSNRNQRIYHLRVLQCEVDGERATHRQTQYIGFLNIQELQETKQVTLHRIWLHTILEHSRVAKTAHIVTYHFEMLSELVELIVPQVVVHKPTMIQHKRMSFSSNFVIQTCAIYFCKSLLNMF